MLFERLNGSDCLIIQEYANNVIIGLNIDKIGLDLKADDIKHIIKKLSFNMEGKRHLGVFKKLETTNNRIKLIKY